MLPAVEKSLGNDIPEYAVIWLHGLGANGHDFAPVVGDLGLKRSVHFVFPHAPARPVTLNNGIVMPAWFDIDKLDEGHSFDRQGMEITLQKIQQWIEHLNTSKGIPSENIALVGFSQGGAVALYGGLKSAVPLAGVMGLSTYLPGAEDFPAALSEHAKRTPFWLGHGTRDQVVLPQWGQLSHEYIAGLGIKSHWETYPMEHTVCTQQLKHIGQWLESVFN
ncbi:MAG: carboxylesterase [Legionellales bacterium]|nr:carboxylesterase [Legionellales bacterium]|tara:strand:+ start:183 stop:842 length:660 start_codon:yes stop_codon:yes gene_type:complete